MTSQTAVTGLPNGGVKYIPPPQDLEKSKIYVAAVTKVKYMPPKEKVKYMLPQLVVIIICSGNSCTGVLMVKSNKAENITFENKTQGNRKK